MSGISSLSVFGMVRQMLTCPAGAKDDYALTVTFIGIEGNGTDGSHPLA